MCHVVEADYIFLLADLNEDNHILRVWCDQDSHDVEAGVDIRHLSHVPEVRAIMIEAGGRSRLQLIGIIDIDKAIIMVEQLALQQLFDRGALPYERRLPLVSIMLGRLDRLLLEQLPRFLHVAQELTELSLSQAAGAFFRQ